MQPDFWHERWRSRRIGFHRDVPLPLKVDQLKAAPNPSLQRSQYERFGFKALLKEVDGGASSAPANATVPPPEPASSTVPPA